MAFIQVVSMEEADGTLAEIYRDLEDSRGKLAAVHQIQSLNPPTIKAHMDLYQSVMFCRSPLSRSQREMMAVVVSSENGCAYCIEHHAAALDHYWKHRERVDSIGRNWREVDLDPKDALLCQFAQEVTRDPAGGADGSAAAALKDSGFEDRAVLDAALVVGYFNFVNRIVLTLGVELEPDSGGYRY